MNRRSFLKSAGIAIAGLILPPEPEKRFWALDRTMLGHSDPEWGMKFLTERMRQDLDLYRAHTTTIVVERPELFKLPDDCMLRIGNEVVYLKSINSDGSFTIIRGG